MARVTPGASASSRASAGSGSGSGGASGASSPPAAAVAGGGALPNRSGKRVGPSIGGASTWVARTTSFWGSSASGGRTGLLRRRWRNLAGARGQRPEAAPVSRSARVVPRIDVRVALSTPAIVAPVSSSSAARKRKTATMCTPVCETALVTAV